MSTGGPEATTVRSKPGIVEEEKSVARMESESESEPVQMQQRLRANKGGMDEEEVPTKPIDR
jgi:hypothetical protein